MLNSDLLHGSKRCNSFYVNPLITLIACLSLSGCFGKSEQSTTNHTDEATVVAEKAQHSDAETDSEAKAEAEPDKPLSPLYSRPQEYPNMVLRRLQYVDNKDGIPIALRVAVPADENGNEIPGKFPTIMVSSAYQPNLLALMPLKFGGGSLLGAPDPYLVKRGYVQVTVDALGTGVSGGGWELFGTEEQDSYGDIVDWVKQQDWYNGKIGTSGISYLAIAALYTAQRRPDDINAVFAPLPMGDAMRGTVGVGGLLNAVFMSQWMQLTQRLSVQNVPVALMNPRYISKITEITNRHAEQTDRFYMPMLNDALNGADYVAYDSDFWRDRSPLEVIDQIKAPTMLMGTLHDVFQRDEPLLFEALKDNNVDTRLLIYNGTHVSHSLEGLIASPQMQTMHQYMLQWFDEYLKGMNTGVDEIPLLSQHVINYPTEDTPAQYRDDSYATTTDWPHPLAKVEKWYLHGDMTVSQELPNDGEPNQTMNAAPPPLLGLAKAKNGYDVDVTLELNDGTRCSPSYEQWTLGFAIITNPRRCYRDNEAIIDKSLNYVTEPMEADYYMNGPLMADFWISSTRTEAVVSVRLDSIAPDGSSTPISTGILVASLRAVDEERSRFIDGELIQPYHFFTKEKAQQLVPNEPTQMKIEIFPTAAVIPRGHRLRVSISPSNQAQGVLNRWRQELVNGGVTTIYNTPQYPSAIALPIVPIEALN